MSLCWLIWQCLADAIGPLVRRPPLHVPAALRAGGPGRRVARLPEDDAPDCAAAGRRARPERAGRHVRDVPRADGVRPAAGASARAAGGGRSGRLVAAGGLRGGAPATVGGLMEYTKRDCVER